MPENLDRCAAYVAARAAQATIRRTAGGWPALAAARAQRAAADTVHSLAEAASHRHGSIGRRRCLREALACAVGIAATVDTARALGASERDVLELQRVAGRTVALIGMFLHANMTVIP